ncbi:hypothetical protein BP6252_02471 [Coleophoma cylindrospora]|uniref:Uncharacterized protein n=1 Tax=Coleophoma cylindrospora TaxID=1849047 RepID=A0A3D8SFB1_9HELO|nr:hypothetical protein BP6252_02471 [Coleophoma cylindrospora]
MADLNFQLPNRKAAESPAPTSASSPSQSANNMSPSLPTALPSTVNGTSVTSIKFPQPPMGSLTPVTILSPLGSADTTPRTSIGTRNGRRSIYPKGDFRESVVSMQELKTMQNGMMAETLNKEQIRKLWTSNGANEGVILKVSKGDYIARPQSLQHETNGLFHQILAMNVRCAMTVNTKLVRVVMTEVEGAHVSLLNGSNIQILPSLDALPYCSKHQFAAFIKDMKVLVVWDDSPENLLRRASELETMLLNTIWKDHDAFCADEKSNTAPFESVVALGPQANGFDSSEDLEALLPEQRKIILLSPMMVALTLALIIACLGFGWRALAVEAAVDGKYTRFALLATSPFLFFLGLFMMQSVIGCLFQMFAPVNQMMNNSMGYSGKAPRRVHGEILPHFTIQMPVYKEGLNAVIRPTIQSLKQAISTYELQGGTANIFINDDGMQLLSESEANERREFYDEHNIGWVARPGHNPRPKKADPNFDESKMFVRRGKFKKASNMNYALMVSNKIEEKLAIISRDENWNQRDEEKVYKHAMNQVLSELNGRAWAEGNIRMGDYILIIDSDTRVPADCLLDAAIEMDNSPEIAIMQYSSGVMKVTDSYFENGIKFFTDLVYTAIRFAVASGDVCPFVGHNAILRWSALQQVTFEEDGYEKFWSESHVSEDFDMALRLQTIGYKLRLAAYQGEGFKEGVSLTVYDELARWEKYAYGCSELIFHPFRLWLTHGPITPLFRRFVYSSMPIGAKLTIMAYIGTYYAIGAAWFLTLANYFLAGWYSGYTDKYYLGSFQIYFAIIIVFTGLGNVALAVLRYRTSEKGLLSSLFENFQWIFLLTIFLGGISLHVSQALLSHLFEIDMSWGATAKEVENTNFFTEIPKLTKKFKFTFVFCFAMVALVFAGFYAFPELWQIRTFNAIYPLCSIVFSHFMLPIALNPALMMFTW